MAVSAQLARVLQDVLGNEGGDLLVDWMVQVDANRSELRDMMNAWNGRTDSRFGEADARMDKHLADMGIRMSAGFADLKESMAAMELRLDRRINDRFNDLLKWSFVFWCGTVAALFLVSRR